MVTRDMYSFVHLLVTLLQCISLGLALSSSLGNQQTSLHILEIFLNFNRYKALQNFPKQANTYGAFLSFQPRVHPLELAKLAFIYQKSFLTLTDKKDCKIFRSRQNTLDQFKGNNEYEKYTVSSNNFHLSQKTQIRSPRPYWWTLVIHLFVQNVNNSINQMCLQC